jgi:hypothetical protein
MHAGVSQCRLALLFEKCKNWVLAHRPVDRAEWQMDNDTSPPLLRCVYNRVINVVINSESIPWINCVWVYHPWINHLALTMDAINPAELGCSLKQVIAGNPRNACIALACTKERWQHPSNLWLSTRSLWLTYWKFLQPFSLQLELSQPLFNHFEHLTATQESNHEWSNPLSPPPRIKINSKVITFYQYIMVINHPLQTQNAINWLIIIHHPIVNAPLSTQTKESSN